MKKQTWELMNAVATGFIVLVLFLLVLFWGRLFCYTGLMNGMPENSLRIIIRPSGLVPGELAPRQNRAQNLKDYVQPGPNEPDFRFSQVSANTFRDNVLFSAIGRIVWSIMSEVLPYYDANERVYWYRDRNKCICFDKRSGLINLRYTPGRVELNDERISVKDELFAGPNGISQTASASLGRFYDPIVNNGGDPSRMGVYDRILRRFYVIDFVEGAVNRSPQLPEEDSREPVVFGNITKGFYTAIVPNVTWNPPEIWNADKGEWRKQRTFLAGEDRLGGEYSILDWSATGRFIPVLDRSGRIYNYDTKEQSLVQVGFLPTPWSLFQSERQNDTAKPRNLLGYNVLPVYADLRLPDDSNKPPKSSDVKYLGMSVASVSREGTAMTLAVFDAGGRQVCHGSTMSGSIPTAEAVYSDMRGPYFATIIEFLLENLQPTVFELASYLCGDCIEASSGHRAIFILPNSFVGMLGRAATDNFFEKQILALLLICPSLVLSVWLAGRIRKDAILIGLSDRAKKLWVAGTIAFGLPAYITYRLTRHKEVLVTCQNCGRMRRPDMQTCHHCGSKWEMPELTPPNWRICD